MAVRPALSNVVAISSARGSTESRTARELRRLLMHAHAMLDQRGVPAQVDRSERLTFEQFQRAPERTSMFGWPL